MLQRIFCLLGQHAVSRYRVRNRDGAFDASCVACGRRIPVTRQG